MIVNHIEAPNPNSQPRASKKDIESKSESKTDTAFV